MPVLEPITHPSTIAGEALGKIIEAIVTGEFKPGERISEAEIARQLGISRGPLREALGRLENRLVTRAPRVGVSVIQLTEKDLVELFTVREALEGMACRAAAEKITDDELRSLKSLLAGHGSDPAVLSSKGYYQRSQNEDFHFQIVRCSRNERLEHLLMESLYYQLRLYRFQASTQPGRAEAAFEEHQEIFDALQARDPERAEHAMRKHIRHALVSLRPGLNVTE
jgi:DNA-binding GntR family transcriptional regulator